MADAADFVRANFKALLADPNGFELTIAPLPDGSAAVRLRTERGNGVREMHVAQLGELMSNLLEAMGGGKINMTANFDFDEFKETKTEELRDLDKQIEELGRRRKRVAAELKVAERCVKQLEKLDESPAKRTPHVAPKSGSDAVLKALRSAGGPLSLKEISERSDVAYGSVTSILTGLIRDHHAERAGRGYYRAAA